MESDQVGAEQTFDDLGAPRHLHEQLDRRERDVQKETDGQVGPQRAQHFRHQLQLVILHPHGPAAGGGARRSLGEPAVDHDIALPPFAVVDRLDDDVVVQRPQRGVREPLVVLGDVLGGQGHLMKCQVILDDRLVVHVDVVVAVGRQPRPADPGAAPAAQQRLQGRDQPPGTAFPGRRSIGKPLQIDRQSIGDNHEVGVPVALRLRCRRVLASPGRHLCLELCRPNTEHGQKDPALIRVVRVRGDDAPGLACCAVSQRLDIADFARIRFRRHDITVGDACIRSQACVGATG